MYGIAPYYLATWCVTLPLEFFPSILLATIQYFLMGLRDGYQYYLVFAGLIVLENQCAIALGMLISASISNVEAAPKVAPAVVILFLMFSGFFLNDDSVPDWLSWLKYISFLRYTFQALAVNEFRGAQFDCDHTRNATICLDGDDWLRSLNFHDVSIGANVAYVLTLIVAFNAIAYYAVLVLRKPNFVEMKVEPKIISATSTACVVKVDSSV